MKSMGCANREESQACLSYPEVQPAIDEVNGLRKPRGEPSLLELSRITFISFIKIQRDEPL